MKLENSDIWAVVVPIAFVAGLMGLYLLTAFSDRIMSLFHALF